jgi:hypothetical protein
MAEASYTRSSFLGGEVSLFAQGRYDRPDYATCLSVCLNGHPVEQGTWTRRPGTQFAGTTRGGAAGRVIRFDFEAVAPITLEFTDGYLRFRSGTSWATTNDAQTISAISTANPAVVNTAATSGWATGNTVVFGNLGSAAPLLQNRQFTIMTVDSTHFSLTDALTGTTIDGSTLGVSGIPATATVSRIQEITTPYVGGAWGTLRAVQAESNAILLQGTLAPQILSVTTLPNPAAGTGPIFALAAAVLNDGPYLDAFTNGVQVTPSGLVGIISLTLSFQAWSATQAYQVGNIVSSGGVNYQSLVDQNVGNPLSVTFSGSNSPHCNATNTFAAGDPVVFFVTGGSLPAALTAGTVYYVIATGLTGSVFEVSATVGGSAIDMATAGSGTQTVALAPAGLSSAWAAVSAGVAINNGAGFQGSDVGRLVRLFSEPPVWVSTTAYSSGNVVQYNPSQIPGQQQYWIATGSTTGNIPGNDQNVSSPKWAVATNAALWTWGRITSLSNNIGGTLAGIAYIGNMTSDGGLAGAFNGTANQTASNGAGYGANNGYVGVNYSGCSPSSQAINSAVVYPSTDRGFVASYPKNGAITFSLYGSNSAPSSATNGTLLGTETINSNTAPVTISSTNSTAYAYVWVVISVKFAGNDLFISQVVLFTAAGTSTSAGVNVEILGPPLLYSTTIFTWRLGVYSNTTGWPTCGCYHQGRLWLGGAVANRFDTSVSNGFSGNNINFAPTDQYGNVLASSGISETFNSDGVNPIQWMIPDQQGVIMGTLAGEWLVSAGSQGPIAPNNITGNRVTKIGGSFVEPRRTEHTIIFAQRYGRKLMEYFADVYSGKFTAPNLAKDAMHLTTGFIAELAYTQAVTPVIWGRNADGSLWGITYKRDTLSTSSGPTYAGWHHHSLGSGRTISSICAGPSTDGNLDALTMVTYDGTTYHVEVMTDLIEEGQTLSQSAYLDDAVAPSSTTSSNSSPAPYGGLTLNGLWHLNGKTVTAWLSGLDCGDYTVSNGSITVPYGDGVSAGTGAGLFTAAAFAANPTALVGFTFTSQGQLVRPHSPAETGARNGPALGKKRRSMQYAVQLEGAGYAGTAGAGSITFGTAFTNPTGGALSPQDPARFKQANDTPYLPNQQFTGIHWQTLQDTYSYNSQLAWQITRPYPANVVAVQGFVETQDK